ncbi:MAG: hypothetical protein MMC33_010371 [Icmadophila ericetorum]|nr:hypothetical protein [Icmadophila ericetorum]
MLLDIGADYTAINKYQEGDTHIAARFGTFEMISLLRVVDLKLLDTYARSISGFKPYIKIEIEKTAMELAKWRRDNNTEWALYSATTLGKDPQNWFAAFKDLVENIRASQMADGCGEFWNSIKSEHVVSDPAHQNTLLKKPKSDPRGESPYRCRAVIPPTSRVRDLPLYIRIQPVRGQRKLVYLDHIFLIATESSLESNEH